MHKDKQRHTLVRATDGGVVNYRGMLSEKAPSLEFKDVEHLHDVLVILLVNAKRNSINFDTVLAEARYTYERSKP